MTGPPHRWGDPYPPRPMPSGTRLARALLIARSTPGHNAPATDPPPPGITPTPPPPALDPTPGYPRGDSYVPTPALLAVLTVAGLLAWVAYGLAIVAATLLALIGFGLVIYATARHRARTRRRDARSFCATGNEGPQHPPSPSPTPPNPPHPERNKRNNDDT